MKIKSIKTHLQPYSIIEKRKTTINHAFASAIAPNDLYDTQVLEAAIVLLGQNPAKDLFCVYCGKNAETWDHVFGLVKDHKFSGYGHVIGNLVPCCKKCNSEKGNGDWESFKKKNKNIGTKINVLKKYFKKYLPRKIEYEGIKEVCPKEIKDLESIKVKILKLFEKADALAENVRIRIKKV